MEEIMQHIEDKDVLKPSKTGNPPVHSSKEVEKDMKAMGELLGEDQLLSFTRSTKRGTKSKSSQHLGGGKSQTSTSRK